MRQQNEHNLTLLQATNVNSKHAYSSCSNLSLILCTFYNFKNLNGTLPSLLHGSPSFSTLSLVLSTQLTRGFSWKHKSYHVRPLLRTLQWLYITWEPKIQNPYPGLASPGWLNFYLPLLSILHLAPIFFQRKKPNKPSYHQIKDFENTIPFAWNALSLDLSRAGSFLSFWSEVKYHSASTLFKAILHPNTGYFQNHYIILFIDLLIVCLPLQESKFC